MSKWLPGTIVWINYNKLHILSAMNRLEPGFRRSALLLLRGLILIAVVTALCLRLGLNPASMALVYLITAVLQSLDSGFMEAALISIVSVACLDFFFMDPLYSLSVSQPSDFVTLGCLLITSLVITHIQSRRRTEERAFTLQSANIQSLNQVSQRLLSLPSPGPALLEPFRSIFDLAAVCLFDASTLESEQVGTSRAGLEAKTRECYISGRDAVYAESGIVVRCLRAKDAISGAIGFEGLRNPELTASPLSAFAAVALETARAFRAATTADAQAHAEMLRSAILDALAHEIKTPLATIVTAAGGLRQNRLMSPEDSELAELIETEALRLGELTSRLLRLARLDREEVKPRMQATDAGELASKVALRYSKMWPDRRVSFSNNHNVGDVRVDPELIGLALSQLLENACRYSQPDSNVLIELTWHDNLAAITVWNDGKPIEVSERHRIFERFYRGAEAHRMAAGTGLGLYVARKIALAHGGNLTLVGVSVDRVGFQLTVPISASEASVWQRQVINC
jgi:two-component system sensor histidine kinase KdpD